MEVRCRPVLPPSTQGLRAEDHVIKIILTPHSLLSIDLSHTESNESVDLSIHDISYKRNHKHLCMASLLPNITHTQTQCLCAVRPIGNAHSSLSLTFLLLYVHPEFPHNYSTNYIHFTFPVYFTFFICKHR